MTCCKPISGAGVVWMDVTLRGWVRSPAMKNGDRLKVLLTTQPLYQGAENAGTMQDRRVACARATMLTKIFLAILRL